MHAELIMGFRRHTVSRSCLFLLKCQMVFTDIHLEAYVVFVLSILLVGLFIWFIVLKFLIWFTYSKDAFRKPCMYSLMSHYSFKPKSCMEIHQENKNALSLELWPLTEKPPD